VMMIHQLTGANDVLRSIPLLMTDAGDDERKYLDHEYWLRGAHRRAERAGLLGGPRRRVLDLGCGAGWFAAYLKTLGHEVVGLDVPGRSQLFRRMCEMLEVPVIEKTIRPFEKLDGIGTFWNHITAFQVCFNSHRNPPIWRAPEWSFFCDDVRPRTEVLYLELNREAMGDTIDADMAAAFELRGGHVLGHRVMIDRRCPL
jgi:SAM-dependent methyltransferase